MTHTTVAPQTSEHAHRPGVFWRYWAASTVSRAGDAITAVALPLVAIELLHATTLQISLITAAGYAAWLLIGLPAGVIVQRLPLRGTQVALDILRAVAVLSVPVAAALGALHLALLVAVALLIGLASVVFDVGNSTFLPSIVSKEELTSRNSLTSASNAATELGGPSAGGVLVQILGPAATLLVDAVSYLVSAVLLRSLPRPSTAPSPKSGVSTVELIKDGWRFVAQHKIIRPCVVAATLINFSCGALTALTPVFLVRTLDVSVGLVGFLMASGGVGSLLGAALTPRLGKRIGSARTVLYATVFLMLSQLLLPLAGSGWALAVFVIGNTGFSCGVVVFSILTRTHRQSVAPPDLLPRVMATVRFVSWGAIPFGALAAGMTATAFGTRGALWLSCTVGLLIPLILLASPVRRARELV
ncbi:MFS transporter [Streptomyces sp.]|uniref:MFS transporter n=1 Tax=Streptomyces sp. TaxID=1931 RepID=UPI002D79F15B|nr:MFS transporter [Streptomyces sp.]HET6356854.1 MFS transporter [Streptomyces sp.]